METRSKIIRYFITNKIEQFKTINCILEETSKEISKFFFFETDTEKNLRVNEEPPPPAPPPKNI